MKHALFPIMFVSVLAPCLAHAQSDVPSDSSMAPVGLEPATALETEPSLPVPPPEMTARVTTLRSIARHTTVCWTGQSEREFHVADERCPRWFAQLARGGAASVYALGQTLLEAVASGDSDVALSGTRLVRLMAATGVREAVPFLLSFVARSTGAVPGRVPWWRAVGTESASLGALAALTGQDVAPVAPWMGERNETDLRAAARAWLAWYRRESGGTPARWQWDGRLQARAALGSSDPVVRVAAIRRLLPIDTQRAAAAFALGELLRSASLEADARAWLTRFARRNRVPVERLPATAAVEANSTQNGTESSRSASTIASRAHGTQTSNP